MGAIANHLGLPADFDYNGTTYKVSPWTYEILGAFERHLEDNAIRSVRRMRSHLTPEEYDKALKGVLADIGLQLYTFGTEEVSKALNVPENVEYMFWLCVSKNHPEVMREDVKVISRTHYGAMIEAMNRANEDPNSPKSQTPAEAKPQA